MSDLERRVHDRVESYRPDAAPPFEAILARSRRRGRVRQLVTVTGAAAALAAVVLAAAVVHRPALPVAARPAAGRPATSGGPTATGNVPPAVARVAERVRADAGAAAVTITWVRTTWGVWRRREGQPREPTARESVPVYIVQGRTAKAQLCPTCKGLSVIYGTVATHVFPVQAGGPSEFTYGDHDYGVPTLPGTRHLP